MLAKKVLHSDNADVFCKLIPFWQLQLYFSGVKGYGDFYADVHEQIRNIKDVPGDDRQQINFMRICCDVSKTDLSEFFQRWGMLAVTSGKATDHSSIQNKVNYTQNFNISENDVADLTNYASKYEKPDAALWYIHDECIDEFKNKSEVEKGQAWIGENYFETNTKHAVAFEVYDDNKLLFISPFSRFKIPVTCKNPVIYAISSTGKSVKIYEFF